VKAGGDEDDDDDDRQLTDGHGRLHPTVYPWEHYRWHKTFDHQG
jgi:hypothetical protein